MTANAPYYQMRSGQFITTSNNANAAQPQFAPEDDEYELHDSVAAVAPLDHLNPHLYSEHAARQVSADHTLEENHNLVELLEAATAADHATQAMDINDAGQTISTAQSRGKRKRHVGSPTTDASHPMDEPANTRRKRHGEPTDPQLQDGEENTRGDLVDGNMSPSSDSLLGDARAAGVHSAAALFRRTSERTRKYTRPPMSKMFMSLQLSPENFLQLQSSAKAYMLDPSHPERQNCVGNRGKGDTDMVKLRLFNCVRDFLSNGAGKQFFGEHVEKPGEKDTIEAARALGEEETPDTYQRLTWPRDGNKIIGLVTPLMRRMVTNERQRQYAIETRKGGSKKKKEGSAEAVTPQGEGHGGHEIEPPFDPNLGHHFQYAQANTSSLAPVASPVCSSQKQVCSTGSKQKADSQGHAASNLKLSKAGTVEPNLSHINIFLVQPSPSNTAGVKIGERRIAAEAQAHLAWYDYDDFIREVKSLLEDDVSNDPELKLRVGAPQEPGTDNLRGLAAAANALQSERAHEEPVATCKEATASMEDAPPASPSLTSAVTHNPAPHQSSDTPVDLLSLCVIKSLGAEGWREIRNADDWYSVLREKAFAIWADGICNVLVELVE